MTRKSGFSLIELLIAMSIMVLMVGIGIASYLNYDAKNKVGLTAEQIKSFIIKNRNQSQSSTSNIGLSAIPKKVIVKYESNGKNITFNVVKKDADDKEIVDPLTKDLLVFDTLDLTAKYTLRPALTTATSGEIVFESSSGKLLSTNPTKLELVSKDTLLANIIITDNNVNLEIIQ
jgi:prepilin-type N-terminal cleavage/methylation domain-containing protein